MCDSSSVDITLFVLQTLSQNTKLFAGKRWVLVPVPTHHSITQRTLVFNLFPRLKYVGAYNKLT